MCHYNYPSGSILSNTFESIETNYPQDGSVTDSVGMACPAGGTEEQIDLLDALAWLGNTVHNDFAVFVFPVDTEQEEAVEGAEYGYCLTVTCDREPCNL